MNTAYFAEFFPAVCAGLGLFLVGVANLILIRCGPVVRVSATLAMLAVALGAAASLDQQGATVRTAQLLALSLMTCLLLCSRRFAVRASALAASLHLATVRYALLTLGGIGLTLGSIVAFERAEEVAADESMAELSQRQGLAPDGTDDSTKAVTDRGTSLALRKRQPTRKATALRNLEEDLLRTFSLNGEVIRRSPPDDRSNCHGWVFTGGRYPVNSDEVGLILMENGYCRVNEPQPGDLVLYGGPTSPGHTAVVRYVTEGQPTLVEGKWGHLGVFLHPADKSVYGVDYGFYRSSRSGHLLVGLAEASFAVRPQTAPAE